MESPGTRLLTSPAPAFNLELRDFLIVGLFAELWAFIQQVLRETPSAGDAQVHPQGGIYVVLCMCFMMSG